MCSKGQSEPNPATRAKENDGIWAIEVFAVPINVNMVGLLDMANTDYLQSKAAYEPLDMQGQEKNLRILPNLCIRLEYC